MDKERNEITEILSDLTLEILYLLTGEDYTIVKKTAAVTPIIHLQESGGCSRAPGPITEPPPHPLKNKEKVLDLTKKMMELLTGELPIRCQDVAVYFSMKEREYIGGHRDLYKDAMMENHRDLYKDLMMEDHRYLYKNVMMDHRDLYKDVIMEDHEDQYKDLMMENHRDLYKNVKMEDHQDLYKDIMMDDNQPLTSSDGSRQRSPLERCHHPPYSRDCPEEKPSVPETYQTMVLLINDPPRMDKDRNNMAAGILDLTMEITNLITGEKIALKETSRYQ